MWKIPEDKSRLGVYAKNAKKAAFFQIAIGIIAIVYPLLSGKLTLVFLSLLFLASGFVLGYFTYITQSKDTQVIRKSILLVLLAFLMNMSTFIGVLSLGILLGIYFFGDAIINTQLSKHLKHDAAKYWLLAAIVALILGIFVLLYLPHSMIHLLGAFIGITYLFNALALYKTSEVFKMEEKA
ncbi:MAG: Unknown protein [uncultured Sulfurovum sp.]|uniref:DUF308 domain-containing protein n=1 Tax=uncultured Sulfurovum sp. TaxID=269237 RepID=A0A6S6UER6_9BACT|nr:MAG: Unknown protein [uncultured Sulfurovum sp.]